MIERAPYFPKFLSLKVIKFKSYANLCISPKKRCADDCGPQPGWNWNILIRTS